LLIISDWYNQQCHENDASERCSLQSNGEQNKNYNIYENCPNDYSDVEYVDQYTDSYQMDDQPEQKRPEILYKSSKELYKAVAKECGISCKMSDNCKCLDCQSRYFDCEYDQVR
jgi:hypothetical protein